MTLSDEELGRYARHIVLPQVGGVGQKKLKSASVAVIGAGGIGSGVIPALSGAGVGRLTIIDSDVVEPSNLHRQPLFCEADSGQAKAELAAEFARQRNCFVDVTATMERIGSGNARDLLSGHDIVVDGSDNFETRLAVNDACVGLGIDLVSAAAVQFQGQVGLFKARPCYRCFVGDAFDTDDCDTCAELGVIGAMTASVGSFAALLAINAIVGIGRDQHGRLHVFDGEALHWRSMRIPADPACRTCGSL